MPWEIIHREGEYCVTKQTTGETVHCHPTKAKAVAHLRALYANTADEKPEAPAEKISKAWTMVLGIVEQLSEDLCGIFKR